MNKELALKRLLTDLESAEAGSTELDAQLLAVLRECGYIVPTATATRGVKNSGPVIIPTQTIAHAMRLREAAFPEWWWSVCDCSVSADASLGPDRQGRDKALLEDRVYDEGFHAQLTQPSSVALALCHVVVQAAHMRLFGQPVTKPWFSDAA